MKNGNGSEGGKIYSYINENKIVTDLLFVTQSGAFWNSEIDKQSKR